VVIFQSQYNDYAMGWMIRESGFDSEQEHRFLFSPARPDRLWGPPCPLSKTDRALTPRGQSGRGVRPMIYTRPDVKNIYTPQYVFMPSCIIRWKICMFFMKDTLVRKHYDRDKGRGNMFG
jgi:hypothetical protein